MFSHKIQITDGFDENKLQKMILFVAPFGRQCENFRRIYLYDIPYMTLLLLSFSECAVLLQFSNYDFQQFFSFFICTFYFPFQRIYAL